MNTIKQIVKKIAKTRFLQVDYGINQIGEHSYFTCTGSIYHEIKKEDKISQFDDTRLINNKFYRVETAGAIHNHILKYAPEFEDIIKLHLCDISGQPSNMYYHLKNGFSDIKKESPEFMKKYCYYYRIPNHLFDELLKSNTELAFFKIIIENKIDDYWKKQAELCILKYEI
jgi:hypothetical protein